MLKVGLEEMRYVEKTFESREDWASFWQEFENSCPVLEAHLRELCTDYVATHTQEDGKTRAFLFLRHAFFIFGALYAANGKKFPRVAEEDVQSAMVEWENQEELRRRGEFFRDNIGGEWIHGFAKSIARTGFCIGSAAQMYALAEMFVKNAEAESAAPTYAAPAEVAERDGKTKPELAQEMDGRMKRLSPLVREFLDRPA